MDTFAGGSLFLGLLDELVTLIISMREHDHDHTVHNLLLFELSEGLSYWEIFNFRMNFPKSCSCQNVLAKDILNEVSHCDIHVNFAS
jgi:hypothetical protein